MIKPLGYSVKNARPICACGKGYASEDKNSPHFGKCNICYRAGLTRRELKELGLKRS